MRMSLKLLFPLGVSLWTWFASPALALEDPTRPSGFQAPVEAPQPEVSFSLDSIMIGGDKRLAVINGQMVREGQTLEQARVLRVAADRVVLSVDGQQRVLRWNIAPQVRTTP